MNKVDLLVRAWGRGVVRWGAFVALGLIYCSAAPPAHAQSGDDTRARTHFQSGRSYYEEGAYDRAFDEFSRAHELSGRPEMLVNMANSLERLGRPQDAADLLKKFLELRPDAPAKAMLTRRVENLERLARQQEARRAAREAEEQAALDASREPEPTAESATEPPQDESTAEVEPTDVRQPEADAPINWAMWSSYGVGVLGLGTFAAFGLMAMSEEGALSDGCGADRTCTTDDVSTADTYALIADIGLGVGILGAAAGTIFLLLDDGEESSDTQVAGASFRAAPVLSPRTIGVMTEVRF